MSTNRLQATVRSRPVADVAAMEHQKTMMRSRLFTFIGVGVAIAETIGFSAVALWARDKYAVGFSFEGLALVALVIAATGGVVGAVAHLVLKPRRVR